jgi:thymidylate kinase
MLSTLQEKNVQFLHIEGMDFSGKTTIAREMAQLAPYLHRHNNIASNEISDLGKAVDRMSESGKYRGLTISMGYVASILADIDNFTWPNKDTIQDSAAAVRCMGRLAVDGHDALLSILNSASRDNHPKFTRSFYLTATIDERLRRLRERGDPSQNDLMLVHDTDKFMAMEEIAMERSVSIFGSEVIDTSKIDPRNLALKIIKEVESTRND